MHPLKKATSEGVPDSFQVTLFDAMILYFNTMRAKQLGWSDADLTVKEFVEEAKRYAIKIDRKDLESMLYACVQNAETRKTKYFWHPFDKDLGTFVKELMRHHSTKQFYYDIYYSFFKEAKGRSTPATLIVSDVDGAPNQGETNGTSV